ncbi:serine/threonine-protein kinase [Streptomyces cavernicola]|uniref:non-specific serine/threonine protein kinase n=1 Tax=Streptomyces cavernicola TaxID=3043613 RepID=A0ABT6S9A7_9ACTN|nr:serine/threonine-protein kinase [Streptomyces sp. B-S-A6]MDI3404695.1 serine/threonine-protein kinase [Streptomyces sp. B-S-A6]
MASGENQQGDGVGRLLAGRYRVQEQLGRGGMGVVWRAVDEVLGRPVAVKELRTFTDAAAAELSALRTRMQREARAAARVRHTGVIAVHDVAEIDGRPLIVMELVDGPSLDDVLRERGTLPPREAAAIGAKVMEALAAAHQAGVLHRDVKPGNILLEGWGSRPGSPGSGGGRVVLTDFGIAMVDDPGDGNSTNLTRSGELVGSLDYLAPERAQGHEPGPASDIWALGATLYGTVEGNAPFRRTSTWSTLTAIVSEPLPAPVQAGPLAPVLQQLMAKDPQARPDAETARRLLLAVAESERDDDTTVLRPGARPASTPTPGAVPPVHGAPTVGSGGFPATPPPGGPYAGGGLDTPNGSDTPLVTPVPGAPGPRKRRRTLIVAAAVLAVLAAGGGGYAWLAGGDGRRVEAGGTASPSAPESPSQEASPTGSGKPKPTEQGDKSPSPSESSPDGSAGEPGEDATKPAGDGGVTGGGSTDGGTTGGGSGGTSGGDGGDSGGSGTSGSGTSGSSGGGAEPDPVCHPAGGGKYDCTVWRTADSYTASGAKVGVLNAGTNYFYCQQNLGRRETYQGWTNVWWAKTDDDSGNTNVFISDVYIKGGEDDKPLPGLPIC